VEYLSGMISSLKHENQLKVISILNNCPQYKLNEKVDHTNKLIENDYNISLKNRPHKLGICYTVFHRESLKAPRAVREKNMVISPVARARSNFAFIHSFSQSVSQSVSHSTRMV
jgi:hypothetical protein